MTDKLIEGKIYLRHGDSTLFKEKGISNVFTGLFGVTHDIPFYFLNFDDNKKLPDPEVICKENKEYSGVLYLLDAPTIGIPNSISTTFSFTKGFTFVKTQRNLVPLANIAYAQYYVKGVSYIAIPYTSVASIEFNYVL